eukprot:scaffold164819_cov56-Prasinocladus_malaysianus.AAC.1
MATPSSSGAAPNAWGRRLAAVSASASSSQNPAGRGNAWSSIPAHDASCHARGQTTACNSSP